MRLVLVLLLGVVDVAMVGVVDVPVVEYLIGYYLLIRPQYGGEGGSQFTITRRGTFNLK